MCEFHESTCNGFGDIWWTDNPIYFSSIDTGSNCVAKDNFPTMIDMDKTVYLFIQCIQFLLTNFSSVKQQRFLPTNNMKL